MTRKWTGLRNGIEVDGEMQRFSDIRYYDGTGANHWYHVVLMEGGIARSASSSSSSAAG